MGLTEIQKLRAPWLFPRYKDKPKTDEGGPDIKKPETRAQPSRKSLPDKKKKTRKVAKKRGTKMAAIMRQLKKLYPVFLSTRPHCEINAPGCQIAATVVHHCKGRGVNEILDEQFWKASCPKCNLYVEENHAWAEARGFKISRHQKPKTI